MKHHEQKLTALILASLLTGSIASFATDLPAYFDYRKAVYTDRNSAASIDVVGSIRFQNPYGSCWTFGTTSSLESSMNLKLKAANLPHITDLSERYLSWMTFAPPLNGGGDGFVFYRKENADSNYAPSTVFQSGDSGYEPVSTLVRYGVTMETRWPYTTNHDGPITDTLMTGVTLDASHGAALHDVFGFEATPGNATTHIAFVNANKEYYKKLIQEQGLLRINLEVDQDFLETTQQQDLLISTWQPAGHAVSLAGWDDSYDMVDRKGNHHIGAWILRNSWDTTWGASGYGYLSYDDTTAFAAGVYNAEMDWGRYTAVNTIAPAGQETGTILSIKDPTYTGPLVATGSFKIADKLTSQASQLLKAVGVYVPDDNMKYDVTVSLKGDTPANTQTIYTKSGTFGADGTPMYKGYRTIDFDKFVYLPASQNYIVTVTLTGKDGTKYDVPLSVDENQTVAAGVSFIYNASTGTWQDTTTLFPADEDARNIAMPMFALNKYSNEANGGDFTVVSLNDNGTGNSEIYLGKANELYTTDLLHPTGRYTLSNMTVELTKGLTDSVYGGVISGEGSVTKTGDGMLALSGANTYAGATNVNAGSMALTGSLQSPVTVASGATFTGNGTINGNLTNSGTLVPGLTAEAQNLFYAAAGNSTKAEIPQVGTLTVNGNFTSTGKLVIPVNGTNISKLAVSGSSTLTGTALSMASGGTNPIVTLKYNYLTSQGGITGNVTTTEVSPYLTLSATTEGNNAYLTATQTQTLGSLPGMTTSENSVGNALNKALLNHIANNPNAASTAEMNSLLYQDTVASRKAMKQITNATQATLIAVSPLTAMTIDATYDRLDTALFDGNVDMNVPGASFDGVPLTIKTTAPMTLDTANNLWFKLLRGYEYYGGTNGGYDLDNKSFGGVIGYDRAVNGTTRVGGLFSYAKTDYSTDVMDGKSHDWRVGVYASHDNGTWKTQGLIAYGNNRYDFNRYVTGDKLDSSYTAKVFDINAKVKYLPQYNRAKSWQVAPYVALAYTHTSQDAYTEDGGTFAQSMDSASNNSYRAEVGVEWKHDMNKDSSFGGSVGYKRVLSGVNPELNGTFAGDTNKFTLYTDNDRNYVTYSVNLKKNTGHNWTVQGEVRGEKSKNNHSEVYSLMAKYAF